MIDTVSRNLTATFFAKGPVKHTFLASIKAMINKKNSILVSCYKILDQKCCLMSLLHFMECTNHAYTPDDLLNRFTK